MDSFEVRFDNPWQVAVVADNTVLFVLERSPDGDSGAVMTALNLGEGRVVYRRPLAGDVRHFALSPKLGMVALADADAGQVVLADPATLTPRLAYFVNGKPVDLVFADDGTTLVVAVAREDGGGELAVWKIKMDKKKGLQRKQERTVSLAGSPVRIAVSRTDAMWRSGWRPPSCRSSGSKPRRRWPPPCCPRRHAMSCGAIRRSKVLCFRTGPMMMNRS